MKRNKIAAGALALAMGLGAVAPSFAAEANDTPAKESLSSSELFKQQYKSLLERTNQERDQYLAAKASYDQAQEAYKASEEKVRATVEEYDQLRTPIEENLQGMIDEESRAWTELDRMILGGVPKHLFKLEETDLTLSGHVGVGTKKDSVDGGVELKKDVPIPFKYIKKVGLSEDALVNEVNKLNLLRKDKKGNKFTEQDLRTAYRNWENAQNALINKEPDIEKVTQKLEEVKAAERDRNVKLTQCKNAKAALDKLVDENGNPLWEKSLAEVKAAAESYKLTVEATEKGILVEGNDTKDDEGKKDDTKNLPSRDQLNKLTESINEAKATIKAVDILKDTASHISDKNEAYLDKLVDEANALITEGQAILDSYDSNSVAFSLFSTAYAAEQETVEKEYDAQDVEDLTNKINDKNAEIKDAIKKIDEEEKAADEKENKEDSKDNKDEKENKEDSKENKDEKENKEDSKENKDEKENKEDSKEENKEDSKDNKEEVVKESEKEDKKDSDKKETTIVKPSKNNVSSNRTAGRNAKTGIAGVAGVAGVLAAASVAYAASKKNN